MTTDDFDYQLPEELIAQTPLKVRDSSRLMVLDKINGNVEHKSLFVFDIEFLCFLKRLHIGKFYFSKFQFHH